MVKLIIKHLIFILTFLGVCEAQKNQPEITSQKRPLIILPAEQGDDATSIHYQLVEIVAAEASQLGRYMYLTGKI